MTACDRLQRLRERARSQFGPERAAQLDPVLVEVARDLDTLAELDLDPDDSPC